jgi:hypothetical protein
MSDVLEFPLLAESGLVDYLGGLAFKVVLGIKQEAIVNKLYLMYFLYYLKDIYRGLFLVDLVGVDWYVY